MKRPALVTHDEEGPLIRPSATFSPRVEGAPRIPLQLLGRPNTFAENTRWAPLPSGERTRGHDLRPRAQTYPAPTFRKGAVVSHLAELVRGNFLHFPGSDSDDPTCKYQSERGGHRDQTGFAPRQPEDDASSGNDRLVRACRRHGGTASRARRCLAHQRWRQSSPRADRGARLEGRSLQGKS